MFLPKRLFLLLLIPFFVNGQDTLSKTSLKLFEINGRAGVWFGLQGKMSIGKISGFTKHKEYTDAAFTKGYSDTVSIFRRRHFGFQSASFLEFGMGSSFKFVNARSWFLKRLRPHMGFYYSDEKLFDHMMGYQARYKIDSLTFVDPSYPAQAIDSVRRGELYYSYTSKLMYAEAGALFDVILNRYFSAYAGFVYGFGLGFDNTFSVRKFEEYYVDSLDGAYGTIGEPLNVRFKEPVTTSQRLTVPIGIHNRFTIKRKYAASFLLEIRPGIEFYKPRHEKAHIIRFATLNAGLRFYFRYFK